MPKPPSKDPYLSSKPLGNSQVLQAKPRLDRSGKRREQSHEKVSKDECG